MATAKPAATASWPVPRWVVPRTRPRRTAPAPAPRTAGTPASSGRARVGSPCRGRSPLPSVRVRHEQLLRREAGQDLGPVRRDDDLLLDPGRRVAVLRRAVRLEGDHHALLQLDRVVDRVQAADDRALVQEQPDAVAELE